MNSTHAAIRLLALALLPLIASAHPGGVDKHGCHTDSRTGEHHCHPERVKDSAATQTPHQPPKAGDEGVFYGPFVSLVDGDTFKAKVQGVVMDFRLEGIDAPERDQPYGGNATQELSRLIKGQQLVLVPSDTDRYGRTVVRVWVGDLDVNRELVRRGAAWFYSEYSHDDSLYTEENTARDRKIGLWALPASSRVEPWVWRKEKR